MFIVVIVFGLFWWAGGTTGHIKEMRRLDLIEKRNQPPVKRYGDEENLPKWVVEARRKMEMNERVESGAKNHYTKNKEK